MKLRKLLLTTITLTVVGAAAKAKNKLIFTIDRSLTKESESNEQEPYPIIIVTKKNHEVLAVISEEDVIYHSSVNVYMDSELID